MFLKVYEAYTFVNIQRLDKKKCFHKFGKFDTFLTDLRKLEINSLLLLYYNNVCFDHPNCFLMTCFLI